MRLHEAIRLGAMLRPQTHGRLFGDGGSCALGAALEATGSQYRKGLYEDIPVRFPVARVSVQHPVKLRLVRVEILVELLNDHPYHWTREAIADWLEPIEEAWFAKQQAMHRAQDLAAATEVQSLAALLGVE